MSSSNNKGLLRKLLLGSGSKGRLWLSLFALFTGTTLLLLSVTIWWNFREIIEGKRDNDSLGSTFITVGKRVTDANMGNVTATQFSQQDLEAAKTAPQVQDAGALIANRFPVYAIFSSSMSFSTEMFLEAVPDRFMDKQPGKWQWAPGNSTVPIIISSEFLNLYNYGFALSQGLPQLSESSIQSIAFQLKAGRGAAEQTYMAQVVGFSDRISSVLVPESFIQYGNEQYAANVDVKPSRLILKVKDPSDPAFVKYLKERDYTTNAEQLRWNRLRSVVDIIASSTGLLALLLMGISTLVFILFIELTIARAQASLQLLLQIGYSPKYLTKFMTGRFLPLSIGALLFALFIVTVTQALAAYWAAKNMQLTISYIPGWPVFAAFTLSLLLLYVLVVRSVASAIR